MSRSHEGNIDYLVTTDSNIGRADKKGSSININFPYILVTSNISPWDWYTKGSANPEHIKALHRRLTEFATVRHLLPKGVGIKVEPFPEPAPPPPPPLVPMGDGATIDLTLEED